MTFSQSFDSDASLLHRTVRTEWRAEMSTTQTWHYILQSIFAAVGRLDKSFSPKDNIRRLQKHKFTFSDSIYIFHILMATFWLTIMREPGFPLKLLIPTLYTIALLIPFTSQFFIPATPIFAYLLAFYSSRFIPESYRPGISVSLLPTLESVLYGANISDILTRVTHPILDIIAWIPYGVGHYIFPFFVAAFLWLFRPKEALHLWGRAFGYLNLVGVLIQIVVPCAAPWYEVIYGLTPANYSMTGSAGGLLRIDALFHSHGYATTFSHSPLVFGAFPSLHSACATMEALFISHFFPQMATYIWVYAGVLYWSTMYLTHHYLIDVVGGACLAIAAFYLFLPDELKDGTATGVSNNGGKLRSKYEAYDLEMPARGRGIETDFSSEVSDEEEMDIAFRSPPTSAAPFVIQHPQGGGGHKHKVSSASLIRADDGVEDGRSPTVSGFAFPPTPTIGTMGERR